MEYTKKIALFDPCTQQEYKEGTLDSMMINYLDKAPSKHFSFDFIFTFNHASKEDDNYEALKIYEEHPNVNKVIIQDLNLSKDLDIYVRPDKRKPDYVPPLGGSSGPNLSFYKSFDLLLCNKDFDYQYFFMLESDSYVCKDFWFDSILKFAENNEFSIAGSKYKGRNKWHYILDYKDHLNGIAIYKNNETLKEILSKGQAFHEKQITNKDWFMNFDIALDQFRRTPEGRELIKEEDDFIDTSFITNVSDPTDSYLTQEEILQEIESTIIVHQKEITELPPERASPMPVLKFNNNHNKKIPLFVHIPRCGGTNVVAWNTLLFHEYCDAKRFPILNIIEEPSLKLRRFIVNIKDTWEINLFCYDHSDVHIKRKEFKSTKLEPHPTLEGKYISKEDPYVDYINIEDLYQFIESGDVEIFSATTIPYSQDISQRTPIKICQELINLSGADPLYYTLVRDPFELTKSIYSYSGMEEPFEPYLRSSFVQDSLIIRALTGLPIQKEIEHYDWKEAEKILNHFMIKDISNMRILLDEVFWECYQINTLSCAQSPPPRALNQSKNPVDYYKEEMHMEMSKSKIPLNELFEARVFYDQKIYNNFTSKGV